MLRVCLNCYGTYTTDSIYQWDLNQTLSITGLNVDDITAIHFCNKKCDTARVVNVTRDSEGVYAPIPNELLEEPYDVIAYVHTINDNQAKTIEIINIPVIKRVKPDDYVFVENVDIVNFERLEGDIADYIATMNNAFNDFTNSTNQNYQSFTSGVTQSQNDFESEFMTEYNERVNNGYFLGPDGATNIQDRLTTLEKQIIDVDAINEATGSPILLTDSGENALTEISIYGRSEQTQYSGKNLLPYPYDETSHTEDTVEWVDNGDGSVTANGTTTTGETSIFYFSKNYTLAPGKYIMSGCPVGGSNATYTLRFIEQSGDTVLFSAIDEGNGVEFELTEEKTVFVFARIYSDATVTNLTFKPMIRLASVIDDTYEPYVGGIPSPNPDYPQDIVNVGAGGTLEVKSTGKNLLPFPYYDGASKTVDGVTTTIDENGWAHIYGTTSTGIDCFNFTFRDVEFPAGTYIVSGVPEGASAETYRGWLGIYKSGTTTSLAKSQVYDKPITFTANEPFTMIYRATAGAGATFDVIYKPMVRRVEVIDDTYESYKSSSISIPLTEPLRGIGDVRDEIGCKDGVYGVIRRIKSIKLLDLTPEFINTTLDTCNNVKYNISDINTLGYDAICSHFTLSTLTNWEYVVGKFKIRETTNSVYFWFDKNITTNEDLTNWLTSNDVRLDYVLAEEVFEPFDDQEVFKNIDTYKNVTYLTNTDNADMWVQYYTNSNIGQRLAKTNDELQLVKSTLGYSCKNILNHNLTSQTFGGLTFTVNDDKSIDIDGEVTTPGVVVLWGGIIKAGSYILKGMEKVSSSIPNGFKMEIANYTTNEFIDYFPGETEKKLVFSVDSDIYISLNWNTLNTICSGTAYPMLRSAKYKDGTYEPGFGDVNTRLARVEKEPILTTPMEIPVGRLGPLSSLAVTALVPDIEGYTPLMSMYVRNTANGDKINVTVYENNNIITNNRTKVILNNETDQIFDDVKAHIIILYVRK